MLDAIYICALLFKGIVFPFIKHQNMNRKQTSLELG